MNGIDNEIAASHDRLSKSLEKPANREARHGQGVDDVFVTTSKIRHPSKEVQK
jgi:hypothetical protein